MRIRRARLLPRNRSHCSGAPGSPIRSEGGTPREPSEIDTRVPADPPLCSANPARLDPSASAPGRPGRHDPLHPPASEGARAGVRRTTAWPAEIGVTIAAAGTYFGVRFLTEGDRTDAIANAERLLRFERAVGVDIEGRVQGFVLDHEALRALGDISYVWLHWPLVVGALVVLLNRDRARFLRLRDTLMWSGAIGLVIFATVPTAPPRFMPGFVGTVSDDARRHYLPYPLEWSNQYAALPSFHVGWTLVACLAIGGLFASRAGKALALVPAALVGLAVVTTGNHYVVDAVLGTAIALAAFAATSSRTRPPADPPTIRLADPG